MYSVELFVNDELDKYVKKVWLGLKKNKISSFMQDIEGKKPHITLAVYHEIVEIESFIAKFNAFFAGRPTMDFRIDVLAAFPASGTLFLSPTITEELLIFHKQFQVAFSEYKHTADPYYLPGNWNPHCTLATKLTPEKLAETFTYCLNDFMPMEGSFEGVGLVDILYEGDCCVSSQTILSKPFI